MKFIQLIYKHYERHKQQQNNNERANRTGD